MKKFSIVLLSALTILLFRLTGYCDNRYEYICKGANESLFYLDTSSITRTDVPNVFRCWYRDVVSDVERQHYVTLGHDRRLYTLSYVMYCFEINLAQNIYKGIEERTYDTNGHLINRSIVTRSVWEKIPSNSVMELMSKAIQRTIQKNTSNRLTANSILFTALLTGVTISVLIVYFYSKFSSHASSEATEHARTATYSRTEEQASTESNINDDFDYPYKDIGKVTGL